METSSSSHWRTCPVAIPVALVAVAVAVIGCSQPSGGATGSAGPVRSQDQATSASSASSVEASGAGTAQGDSTITSPPVEFTACIPRNTPFRAGTEEEIVLPSPDEDVTVEVTRGFTWRGTITATDDRLSGTHYYSWHADAYTLPDGGTPISWAEAQRIENDEGAWQGSSVGFNDAGDDSETGPAVLIGEGSYEGLTAIIVTSEQGDCFLNVRGFVMSVPATPAPVTEE